MKARLNYQIESERLSKAIDIANEALMKFPPKNWTNENLKHFEKCYLEWKDLALNPEPKFKTISSLKYLIESVFTFFNESSGEAVEFFWKLIRDQNLNYKREDKLSKILQRGNIKGQIEYEYLVDALVIAKQDKRISASEFQLLSSMIGDFEEKIKTSGNSW